MTALDDMNDRIDKLEERCDAFSKKVVIVGTIMPYGGESPPKGWFLCDGRPLDRGEYSDLYKVIGTSFGAPNNEHFNLPDLRGRFVRGVDNSAGRDPDAGKRQASVINGNTGDKIGSVQEDAIGKHKHKISSAHARLAGGKSPNDPPAVAGFPQKYTNKPHTDDSGGPETRPKNIYVNWIIYAGIKTQ